MIAFGPKLWYDYNFDASKLWKNVEVNSIGAEIIWGPMFADYKVDQALKAIQCPVFLALGRYDYFNPPHLWGKYCENIKNLTIHIFEESSHTPQLEEPEHFDHAILSWLKLI
jgi:proline iminopeptidase